MSSETTTIYNSRKTLLEILSNLGYNMDDYNSFSMNEVEAMTRNSQLDMLVEYSPEMDTAYKNTKIYIKYMLASKAIRLKAMLEELVEELFDLEEIGGRSLFISPSLLATAIILSPINSGS